jgi:hypothetical protein
MKSFQEEEKRKKKEDWIALLCVNDTSFAMTEKIHDSYRKRKKT